MSWLLTHIETYNRAGTTTTTTETPTTTAQTSVIGESTKTRSSTRTTTAGTRVSTRTIDSDGVQTQKSHYAMQVHLEIPVHNRQPVASS